MKKFVALLVALLCLLMGSALAAKKYSVELGKDVLSVSEDAPIAYAKAVNSGDVTDVNIGTAKDHNIKLELRNGELILTFKNVDFKSKAYGIVPPKGVPLTLRGVGTNSIYTAYESVYGNSKLTIEGSFESIFSQHSGIGVIYIGSGGTQPSVIVAKGAHIGDISSDSGNGGGIAVSGASSIGIVMNGRIDSIGGNGKPNSGLSCFTGVQVNGSIGSIKAYNNGIVASGGPVQINGSVGEIDSLVYGIYSGGEVKINAPLGPISVGNPYTMPATVFAKSGITLGSGVRMDGEIAKLRNEDGEYYSIVRSGDTVPCLDVQFVKAAAPATGDGMNIALWASLLTVSLIGIAVLSRKAKREY